MKPYAASMIVLLFVASAASFAGTVDYDVVTNSPLDVCVDAGTAFTFGEQLDMSLNYGIMAQYGIVSIFCDHSIAQLMTNIMGAETDNDAVLALYSDFTAGASVNIPLFTTTASDRIIYASDSTFNYFFLVPSETYHSIDIRAGYNILSAPAVRNVFLDGISFDYGFSAMRQGPVVGLAWMSRRYIEVEADRHVYCSGQFWQIGFDVIMADMAADSVYGTSASFADGISWRLFGEITGCSGKKNGTGNVAMSLYFGIEKRPPFTVIDPYTERDHEGDLWYDGYSISLGLNFGYCTSLFRK